MDQVFGPRFPELMNPILIFDPAVSTFPPPSMSSLIDERLAAYRQSLGPHLLPEKAVSLECVIRQ